MQDDARKTRNTVAKNSGFIQNYNVTGAKSWQKTSRIELLHTRKCV